MGENHIGKILRRIFCVAIAIAVLTDIYEVSASAAEESTVQVAKTGTKGIVYGRSSIAEPVASEKVTEPLRTSLTDDLAVTGGVSEPPSVAHAGEIESPAEGFFASGDFKDEEIYDLILAVRRKRDILSSEIVGVERGFNYYLPVMGMGHILLFPSEADLTNGKVSGTFFNTENEYSIDARNGTFTVRGETFNMPEGSYIINDLGQNIGDIYITPEVLNQIWPLELEINTSELTVNIATKKLLPYEMERERKIRQGLLAGESEEDKPKFEFIPNNYKLLSRPLFNLSNAVSWDDGEKQFQNTSNIAGRGDVLGASADYTINMNYDNDEGYNLSNLRFRMTREDMGDGSLPFKLKLLQAGDVSAKPSPLINKFFSGRGVYLSTSSKPRNQVFDEATIDGTAQPGWEVELYRGNELIDFGFVDEIGQYRFDNVPLNFGNNDIRVVLYGPQGQIEERASDYRIKRTQLATGQATAEASILDNGVPLFDVRDNKPPSSAVSSTKFLRLNRGISPWVTGFATFTQTPSRELGKEKKYATLGAEFNALGGAGQVELYRDFDGGNIFDTRYSTGFAGINTSFRTSFLKDFESNEAGFGSNAKTFEGEFRAAKSFNLGTNSLGLNFDTLHTKRQNDNTTTRTRFSQSLSRDRYNLTNSFSQTRTNGNFTATEGTVALNTVLSPRWNLRSSLDYELKPNSEVDSARIDLRYSDLDKFTAGIDVEHDLNDSESTSVGLTAGYDFSTFLGSADFDWDSQEGFDIILRAGTTLGPDGENGDYIFTTDYKGYTTALKMRLFEDKDSNGVFDGNDRPVEGGKVFVGPRRTQPSDAQGYIELLGAGPPGLVDISVDQESLPNPFLVPIKDGYSTVLRPRSKPYIEFALIESGGIDGTVRFADGRPIPGLIIQLLSYDGVVLKETTTLSDGFYAFEFVKSGTYTVQVSPSHKINVPPITVSVTSEEIFAYGADLTLLEQAAEVSAADEADGESGRVAQLHHAPVADGTLQPAPYSSDGGFQAVVRSVRIGEHPYKVRLVLDLSGPTGYKISSENGGETINIDLPSTAWDADRYHDLSKHPIFSQCEALSLDGGTGTRLKLTARSPVTIFYNTTLPPAEGLSDRIYIDFLKSGVSAP